MYRHFTSMLSLIAAGAVVALAAVAFADVPNDTYEISDKDYADAEGFLGAEDDTFRSGAAVRCAPASESDGPEGTTVVVVSNHADDVALKNGKAATGQSEKENLPDVFVRTGGGSGTINAQLTCEKAEVETDVKTKKSPIEGSFDAKTKNCICVPTDFENSEGVCTGHDNRLAQVATDCADLKIIKVKIDGNVIQQITIKGKGPAEAGGEF